MAAARPVAPSVSGTRTFCATADGVIRTRSTGGVVGSVPACLALPGMKADFTEVYKGAGVERVETGTLWLKKPGKMRWEYRSPKEKLFISDGKDVWLYVPDQHQVRKMVLKKLEDLRSPIAFLLGKSNLQKELQGLSRAPDAHGAQWLVVSE